MEYLEDNLDEWLGEELEVSPLLWCDCSRPASRGAKVHCYFSCILIRTKPEFALSAQIFPMSESYEDDANKIKRGIQNALAMWV